MKTVIPVVWLWALTHTLTHTHRQTDRLTQTDQHSIAAHTVRMVTELPQKMQYADNTT